MPRYAGGKAVEAKVKAATAGTYLASAAALAVLNAVQADASLIAGLPDWLEALLLPLVPTAIAFISGYEAPHTQRPDVDPYDARHLRADP